MTPLEALANLKHALDLYGIHHDRFADAVEEALAEFSSVGFARFSLHSKTSDAQQAA